MKQGDSRRLILLVLFLLSALGWAIAASGCAGKGGDMGAVAEPRSAPQTVRDFPDKLVVGETVRIAVAEAGLEFLARIDTGARVTSIHALDAQVTGGAEDKRDNIGKPVRFRTVNAEGEERSLESTIVDVASVRNAQGTEYRYVVRLTLVWKGFEKVVQVNLRDRSAMTYKLLIGRNWLAKDFVVDVDQGTPDE